MKSRFMSDVQSFVAFSYTLELMEMQKLDKERAAIRKYSISITLTSSVNL